MFTSLLLALMPAQYVESKEFSRETQEAALAATAGIVHVATNGEGTYPAGRFVTLDPLADGRFRLDFNRARNPFCAYSSAYPCPVPWTGNRIEARIEAGEQYRGLPDS